MMKSPPPPTKEIVKTEPPKNAVIPEMPVEEMFVGAGNVCAPSKDPNVDAPGVQEMAGALTPNDRLLEPVTFVRLAKIQT